MKKREKRDGDGATLESSLSLRSLAEAAAAGGGGEEEEQAERVEERGS